MALTALLLLARVASGRLGGRFAAILTAALALAASPLVLSMQAAQAYHDTTWFGTALLAAFLCWLLTSRPGRIATVTVAGVVAALVCFATATDPLLGPTGDVPFVAALLLVKSDFQIQVRPVTEQFMNNAEKCAQPICPYAHNSVSDWYTGDSRPTLILIDPEMERLGQPPPDSLEAHVQVLHAGRFTIYVYADDVAMRMGMPPKFTRPLL